MRDEIRIGGRQMSIDDDVLAEFEEGLDAIKGSPKAKAKTREDLIEQAQENFGSFFGFVPKLDASVKEKMGGNAGVAFDFGDYDEANSKLGAFLIISPAEAERGNLTIPVQFQGKRVGFDNPAFRQSSGSSTFDPANIDQAKRMLAAAVLGWLKK
jgi:hypothetical protein